MNFFSKKDITSDSNFRKLGETEVFVLGHVYENTLLFDKKKKKEILIGFFYGDPSCGLISPNNDWAFVGGQYLAVWQKDHGVIEINEEEVAWVEDVRLISKNSVEFLIDPWSDHSAVWTLNMLTLERIKIKDFKPDDGDERPFNW